ncbi:MULTISPECIES: hypothetical protein [unclassified Azospirillum]|uniref:hypothetical protein n=1 Tax=unclassified Azospirillum TaxID=2630922 RepID=UPI000B767751|nr:MULTISPECIES: hypothetical protein [unclassified Azospirillum]SNS59032.1 hypothetical protein SAMN05880556_107196 [Azospirillum sp. RU38E]SNS78755.1 hypothetical protein SAMN05880591_107196 [Azospirillum sp. RU37A]
MGKLPFQPAGRRFAALALSGLLLGIALPVLAADEPPPPPPGTPAEQADEVIVTAPRNGEPGFQESDDYHRQEYVRLHAKFGKPPKAEPRGDAVLSRADMASSPNTREFASNQELVRNAPKLRDTLGDN